MKTLRTGRIFTPKKQIKPKKPISKTNISVPEQKKAWVERLYKIFYKSSLPGNKDLQNDYHAKVLTALNLIPKAVESVQYIVFKGKTVILRVEPEFAEFFRKTLRVASLVENGEDTVINLLQRK